MVKTIGKIFEMNGHPIATKGMLINQAKTSPIITPTAESVNKKKNNCTKYDVKQWRIDKANIDIDHVPK